MSDGIDLLSEMLAAYCDQQIIKLNLHALTIERVHRNCDSNA